MLISSQRVVNSFCDLVRIDSPSFQEREMADYLTQKLTSMGLSVCEDNAGEKIGGTAGNLLATLPGEGEPILFCTHMDTVEPALGKEAVVHPNGMITSKANTVLGADDLAGLSAVLEAVQTILDKDLPHRPLELLFTVAEEVYCQGASVFDTSQIKAKECYTLDLSGPIGKAAYQAPSILSFTAQIKGKSAHAGFAPQEGIHAIQGASLSISQLKLGQIDEQTTANVGIIQGGEGTNIVPEHCLVKGEVRSFSHDKAQEQIQHIQKVFEQSCQSIGAAVDFSWVCHIKAYQTDCSLPVVTRYEQVCRQMGIEPQLTTTLGGSDYNFLAEVEGLNGLVLASAMNQCHSCEEYTSVEDISKVAELALQLMIR